MRRNSLLLAMMIGPWLAALAGCTAESGILRSPGGPAVAMQVFVRDSTSHEPIPGAAISAETSSRDHPFSAASILYQAGPETSRGRTDEKGSAVVSVLDEREFRVVVWVPGRAPVVFGPALLAGKMGEWVEAELPPDGTNPGVQLRIAEEDVSASR